VQPPLTVADKEVLVALAKEEERFAEQDVEVTFTEPAHRPPTRGE
jgi:hypothetical protein